MLPLVLMLGLTLPLAAGPSPGPAAGGKADVRKMQGTWGIVSLGGADKAALDVKALKFVFDKDTLRMKGLPGDMAVSRKIKLSVVKGVGHFDLLEGGGISPVK